MTLINTLKQKSKKLAVGVALGGALLGAGCSKENTEEIKDNEAKMEQRADNKSEIKDARKKVGYLDEYLAAIERGENKDEAYRILTLKMADNNQKAAEQMQKQAEAYFFYVLVYRQPACCFPFAPFACSVLQFLRYR